MKSRNIIIIVIVLLGSVLFSSCSGSIGSASWPGMTVTENRLYLSYSNSVFAIGINDGNLAWRFPSEPKNTIQFYAPVAVTADQLTVGDYVKNLYSIDPNTGTQKWTFTNAKGRWIGGALAIDNPDNGNLILAPNADHKLYALSSLGQLQWTFEGSKEPLWAQPVVEEEVVYQASMDHFIYAIDLKNGNQLGSMELDGAMVYAPLLADGVLYIPTLGDTIYAIRTSDKQILWQFKTSEEVWGSPVIHEGTLFFADLSGKIYGVNVLDGKQVWSVEAGGAVAGSAALTSEGLVFLTETGDVLLVGFDGTKLWTRTTGGKLYGSAAIGDDRIVVSVVGGDQLLVAFDFRGNQVWTFVPPK